MPNTARHDARSLVILIPVFDDWDSVALLLPRLDASLVDSGLTAQVLLVDDASISEPSEALRKLALAQIRSVHVLPLRRNLGHQRAIALGLAYVEAQMPCDVVVVMDGDGEDTPEDMRRLLEQSRQLQDKHIVFAERTQRAEGLLFRAFYRGYRAIHRVLTGKSVYFGNFSVVPRPLLRRVVVVSELWNHYAAAVMRSRIPYTALRTTRGVRLAGQSRMSFVSLVTHGLSAMSVHADLAGVRLLVANAITIFVIGSGLSIVVGLRLFTELAIPGWASTIGMLLLVLMSQSAVLSLVFVFMTLQGRAVHGFVPARDYVHYIDTAYQLVPAAP